MRHFLITLSCIVLAIFWTSCRKDFSTTASNGQLEFSRDTVYLDTIFTNIGSSTYNLKVYNRSSEDIHIPTIALARGTNSNFRLNVDGIPGQSFSNIEIKAKDSIFIFVETTVDIQDFTTTATDFLYKDSILFDGANFPQDVKLVTLVKDAVFLYPPQLNDGQLNDFDLTAAQLNWTNEKPYVIYGYPKVTSGNTLTIAPGARIHFHRNSGLIIENGATIIADGALSTDAEALENEIIFEGDRLEPLFSNIPGQWGTIWLQEGSTNNIFDYCTIKNGIIGLRSDGNDGNLTTTITNSQFYNFSSTALLTLNSNIEARNMVVNNCGQSSITLALGGTYDFKHCTIANYWSSGFRNQPALLVSNSFLNGNTLLVSNLAQANFTNCLIYGSENLEFKLEKTDGAAFNYNFENCLIRFNDFSNQFSSDPLYDFNNAALFTNIFRNDDPVFFDRSKNDLRIEEGTSGAENKAKDLVPSFNDILGAARPTGQSDIGAYQAIPKPAN